jgi:hypothetical protein
MTQFASGPTDSGVNGISTTAILQMTTDVMVFFPTSSLQQTVYCNPEIKDFQIRIGDRVYHWRQAKTNGVTEFNLQESMSNFSYMNADGPSLSFVNSMLSNRVGPNDTVIPVMSDATSFIWSERLERKIGGPHILFDGIDTKGNSVNVQLFGSVMNAPFYPNGSTCPPKFGWVSTQFIMWWIDPRTGKQVCKLNRTADEIANVSNLIGALP